MPDIVSVTEAIGAHKVEIGELARAFRRTCQGYSALQAQRARKRHPYPVKETRLFGVAEEVPLAPGCGQRPIAAKNGKQAVHNSVEPVHTCQGIRTDAER